MMRRIERLLFGSRESGAYVVETMLLWPEKSEELRDMRANFATEKPALIDMFVGEMCETLRGTMAQPQGQPDHMTPRLSGAVGLWELISGEMPRPCPFAGLAMMGSLMGDDDFARRMRAAEGDYRAEPERFADHHAQERLYCNHVDGHPLIGCGTPEHLAFWTRYVIFDMPVTMTDDQAEYERLGREETDALRAYRAKRSRD